MEPCDQEQILRPRKRKWTLVLLGSVSFVAIGLMMLRDPNESRVITGFFLGFFALCGVVSLVQFVPGSSFLQLTPEGLTVRTMWRTQSHRWSDIEQFGVAEFSSGRHRQKLVGFDFAASYPSEGMARKMRDLNRRLSGFEASLPDNYGWKYAELAEHLNTLKVRYTGRS
jgi:hypothetical protein